MNAWKARIWGWAIVDCSLGCFTSQLLDTSDFLFPATSTVAHTEDITKLHLKFSWTAQERRSRMNHSIIVLCTCKFLFTVTLELQPPHN